MPLSTGIEMSNEDDFRPLKDLMSTPGLVLRGSGPLTIPR